MKIDRRTLKSQSGPERKKGTQKSEKGESFLEALLLNNQEVNAIDPQSVVEQDVKNLAAMIEQYGEDLTNNPTPENFLRYKQHIKSFINIIKNNFEIKNISSRKGFTSQKLYLTIENLDEKLNDLAQLVLSREQNRISYLKLTDNIKGLIIDLIL